MDTMREELKRNKFDISKLEANEDYKSLNKRNRGEL